MTTSDTTHRRGSRRSWLGTALHEFPWIHLGIGLFGNLLFFVGSVLFFWPAAKDVGIWMFVVGSLGMLLGSVGEIVVRIEKHRHRDG